MKSLCVWFFVFLVSLQPALAEDFNFSTSQTANNSTTLLEYFRLSFTGCNSGTFCSNPYADVFAVSRLHKSFELQDSVEDHLSFGQNGQNSSKVIVLSVGENWEVVFGRIGNKNPADEYLSNKALGVRGVWEFNF